MPLGFDDEPTHVPLSFAEEKPEWVVVESADGRMALRIAAISAIVDTGDGVTCHIIADGQRYTVNADSGALVTAIIGECAVAVVSDPTSEEVEE